MVYDDDVLYAAAWLHDLGVFIGHRPDDPQALQRWNNIAYAVEVVPGLLEGFGFPAPKIPAVLAAIAEHLPQGQPSTPEGVILRDADLLEQLGAIIILRTTAKIGRDTRYHTFGDALGFLKRNLATIPDLLHLERTRQLAPPRIAMLQAFIAAAEEESLGLAL